MCKRIGLCIRSVVLFLYRLVCCPCRRLCPRKQQSVLPFTNPSSGGNNQDYSAAIINGSNIGGGGADWQNWDNRLSTAIEDKIQQFRENKAKEQELIDRRLEEKRLKEESERMLFQEIEPQTIVTKKKVIKPRTSNRARPPSIADRFAVADDVFVPPNQGAELGTLSDEDGVMGTGDSQWGTVDDGIDVDDALKQARRADRERRQRSRPLKQSLITVDLDA